MFYNFIATQKPYLELDLTLQEEKYEKFFFS